LVIDGGFVAKAIELDEKNVKVSPEFGHFPPQIDS
jgi:hypothetical protein